MTIGNKLPVRAMTSVSSQSTTRRNTATTTGRPNWGYSAENSFTSGRVEKNPYVLKGIETLKKAKVSSPDAKRVLEILSSGRMLNPGELKELNGVDDKPGLLKSLEGKLSKADFDAVNNAVVVKQIVRNFFDWVIEDGRKVGGWGSEAKYV